MKKNIKIEIPTSWESITLRKYLDLQNDLETYSDNEEAQFASMFYHLCGLNPEWITKLSLTSYNTLKSKLNSFANPKDVELQPFVKIKGVEYGFEPNLSTMSYGAYSDITSFDVLKIDKNWAKIMNILYRPITLKSGKLYQIESYEPNDDWEKWLDVSMEVHFGAWFFFINLQKDLLNATLSSLKETELPPNIKSILVKSGKIIQQFTN